MAAHMGNIFKCQNIFLLTQITNQQRLPFLRYASVSSKISTSHEKIIIPKKKQRDELSILRALASTVEKDYDAPHYKYIDDPYLIPTNFKDKKTFAMARASGKQAAQHVMQNYSEFFQNRPIEDFSCTPEAYKVKEVPKLDADSLEGLEERIEMKKTILAYQSYQQIKDKGDDIPIEIIHNLLDLLCFYNSEDPERTKDLEEINIERELQEKPRKRNIVNEWKKDGTAEMLFREIKDPSHRAYSSILRGRVKYGASVSVLKLHSEMKTKNIKLKRQDYIAILSACHGLFKSDEKIRTLTAILKEMHADGIDPNIDVFNTILNVLSMSMKSESRKEYLKYAINVINEMRHCGIEPTLASWFYTLKMNYSSKNESDSTSKILYELMDYLQEKEFTMHHAHDCEFFALAMRTACEDLQDLQLGYKIDALMNFKNNTQFLGDTMAVIVYYFNYLKLLCRYEEIDTVMEYYDKITPHDYTVSFGVMKEILRAIDLHEAFHHLPRLWSDFLLFNYQRREDLLVQLLRIMAKTKHDDELQNRFVEITDYLLEQYKKDRTQHMLRAFQFTGDVIGECISICCHSDHFENAKELFDIYFAGRLVMERFPSENSMEVFAELCVKNKDLPTAMNVCTVMGDLAYSKLDKVVEQMKEKLDLSEEHLNHLNDIL